MPAHGLLIALGGPTASGKTDLAIELAQHFNTHILSADSRQFYKELSIGSAAPTAEQLLAAPHHFIADRSVHQSVSAAQFAREAHALLAKLFSEHLVVIAVGGSGLYLKALTEGLSQLPEVNENIRKAISIELMEQGLVATVNKLLAIDPAAGRLVALDNPRRVTRALELVMQTGQTLAELYTESVSPDFDVVKVALTRPRDDLYARINHRVDIMLEAGLQAEAEQLYAHKALPSLQTVGYREIFDCMDGLTDRREAVRLIKQNTRHFAKRQLTWFSNAKAGYRWVNTVDNILALLP